MFGEMILTWSLEQWMFITRLRQSINIEGAKPLIRTVRSAGYSLEIN